MIRSSFDAHSQRSRSSRAGAGGFTLIELMVVIAIIAILAAILVPNFVHARAEANGAACRSNLKTMAQVFETYAVDNSGAYPNAPPQIIPTYIATIPTCPSTGTASYGVDVNPAPENAYTLSCRGDNHIQIGLDTGYPQYVGGVGLLDQ